MGVVDNFNNIWFQISDKIKLIVVSKNQNIEDILSIYKLGHKYFGENRVQELISKYEHLPKDIEWHQIGHLQTNKVKYIAPFVSLIHSVDSLKLLEEINKQALINNRIISCFLQFHIASEETKFGLSLEEAELILSSHSYLHLDNIQIQGIMGMASNVENEEIISKEFNELKNIFKYLKQKYFFNTNNFTEISMGMSSDYKIAIASGSTMLRIGSLIFE